MKSSVYEPSFGQDYAMVIKRSVNNWWWLYLAILVYAFVIIFTAGWASALGSVFLSAVGGLAGGLYDTLMVRRHRLRQTAVLHAVYGDRARVFYSNAGY